VPLDPHPFADRWNHNSHYYPRIRAALPESARTVLDVGCGDGTLARYLASGDRRVIGLDVDAAPLPRKSDGASYVQGSAEALPFADDSLDAIVLVMVLHHVDAPRALAEFRRVLGRGGRLELLGYGRSRTAFDWLGEGGDLLVQQLYAHSMRRWDPPVRMADPTLTWAENRRLLESELPGGRYRRLPMWRFEYSWSAAL
jgi:ubiquinone/menaquinone biosynthesis C-methylase UbiE